MTPTLDAAGRYRLDEQIATGGMGEVWRATDTVLDRPVAVKVLKDEYAGDETFRSRFQAEARHAAALHHPNVASVFDFGETIADGRPSRPFLVMELVPGQPLSSLLRPGEPMPPERAAALVAEAADALAAAHALGIVHRDVKPANLLVTPDGTVKITDFGIARAAGYAPLTQTGQIIGTPHYLSPEQAEGKAATPASDVYALGVVLYECLTGRRLFEADSPMATALAHVRQPAPPLPEDLPESLRGIVATALAKNPADRFGSAADLAAALRSGPVEPVPSATVAAAAAAAGPEGTRLLTQPPARRRALPGWAPWAGTGAALLVAVVVVALLSGPSTRSTPSAKASSPPTRSTSPSTAPELVRVRQGRFLGTPAAQASDVLRRRGFHVDPTPVDNPGDEVGGTVAGIRPHGLVARGRTLTLLVWGPPPAPEPGPPGKEKHPKPDKHEHGPKHDDGHGKAKGKKKP